MVIGDAFLWSDTFPADLVPRLLDLVTNTWGRFSKPAPSDHEVPITHRFKHALKQAKDLQRLPVRIEREQMEDHPVTGEELGRIDLKFLPAVSALEEVYFAFECKRLISFENGVRRTHSPEYVTEGMMRFVTGQYSSSAQQGGMIGYVLYGRCEDAIRLVEQNIVTHAAQLRITGAPALVRSTVRPEHPSIRQTSHDFQPSRKFTMHHVFLECNLVIARKVARPRVKQSRKSIPKASPSESEPNHKNPMATLDHTPAKSGRR